MKSLAVKINLNPGVILALCLSETGLGHPLGLARQPFVLIDKANELNAEWQPLDLK